MNRATKIILILLLLLIVALGGGAYFFWQYMKAERAPADTGNIVANEEAAAIIRAVAQHAVVPQGEEPTVATITDTSLLEGQEFFRNAKMGYKVLVYQEARLAILYDPASDRIVNMATINLEQPAPTPTPAPEPEDGPVLPPEEAVQ